MSAYFFLMGNLTGSLTLCHTPLLLLHIDLAVDVPRLHLATVCSSFLEQRVISSIFCTKSALAQSNHLCVRLTITSFRLFKAMMWHLLVEPRVGNMLVPALLSRVTNAMVIVTTKLETLASSTRVPVHLTVGKGVKTFAGGCRDG